MLYTAPTVYHPALDIVRGLRPRIGSSSKQFKMGSKVGYKCWLVRSMQKSRSLQIMTGYYTHIALSLEVCKKIYSSLMFQLSQVP